MYNHFRHGIIQHSISINVQTFLHYVDGYVNLRAYGTPLIYTIAEKNSDYLFTETVDVNEAWEVRRDKRTWIGIRIDKISGERHFISTTVQPEVGFKQPTGTKDQYWFNLTDTTMYRWNGASFVPIVAIFLAIVEMGRFTSLVGLHTFIGSTVGLNVDCNPGSILFDDSGQILIKSNGNLLTTEDRMSAAVHKNSHVKIGSVGFLAIAGEQIPRHHMVRLHTDGRVYLTNGSKVGSYLCGIVESEHHAGDTVRVCTEGFFEDNEWNWNTIGKQVYADNGGRLTDNPEGRYIPIGYVTSRTSIYLSNIGQYHVHPVIGEGPKGEKGDKGDKGDSAPINPIQLSSVNQILSAASQHPRQVCLDMNNTFVDDNLVLIGRPVPVDPDNNGIVYMVLLPVNDCYGESMATISVDDNSTVLIEGNIISVRGQHVTAWSIKAVVNKHRDGIVGVQSHCVTYDGTTDDGIKFEVTPNNGIAIVHRHTYGLEPNLMGCIRVSTVQHAAEFHTQNRM